MLVLTLNQNMQNYLLKHYQQYEINTNDININKMYQKEQTILKWYKTNIITINGIKQKEIYSDLFMQVNEINYVGCDEVGIGDYFGPEVYVSVKLTQEAINKLAQLCLPIKDSKKLKDEEIFFMCKQLNQFLEYKYQINYDDKIENSVSRKVIFHHQNLFENEKTIIDLFTTINSFNKYSKEKNLNWPKGIILENKADSKYICVALASIIARGIFLTEIKKIEKKYRIKLPLGNNFDKIYIDNFIKKYGKDELDKIAKTSFQKKE